jgi:transposase
MSDEQADRLLACFVAGTPARPAAGIAGVNRNTARVYYERLRETIARHMDEIAPFAGEIEAADLDLKDPGLPPQRPDFVRVVPLCGLLERAGHVHVVPIAGDLQPSPSSAARAPSELKLDAIVCSDEPSPEAAADAGKRRRMRIVIRDDLERDLPRRRAIGRFWNRTLRHLRRFNGVSRQHLFLYLKECEWRFNDGSSEKLLHTLKSWAIETN